jgi:hypothetical protein
MAEKKTLSAKEVVADIRAGATDEFLMKKYGISDNGLQNLFQKLIDAKILNLIDLDRRASAFEKVEAITEFCKDIRSRLCDFALMGKYGLSLDLLQVLFKKAVEKGLITQQEIEERNSQGTCHAIPNTNADIDRKISLLEEALKAGLISQDDFNGKRTKLITQPIILANLEELLRFGVLTEDEFQKKRSQITDQPTENENEFEKKKSDGNRTVEAPPENLPIVLNTFPQAHPQPEILGEFSQLFDRITKEEQIEPGLYRYVGISKYGPWTEVIGNDQDVIAARLVWAKPITSEEMGNMVGHFTLGFLMSFCPGYHEDDYIELIHWVVDKGTYKGEYSFDKVVGQRRIEVANKYTSCQLTIEAI